MMAMSVITILFILTGMLLSWTPLSCSQIEGVQGRYFLPIALIMLLPLRGSRLRIGTGYDGHLLAALPAVYMFVFSCIIAAI